MLVKDGKVKIVYSLTEALETLAAAKNLKDYFQPILRILESLVSFFCFVSGKTSQRAKQKAKQYTENLIAK